MKKVLLLAALMVALVGCGESYKEEQARKDKERQAKLDATKRAEDWKVKLEVCTGSKLKRVDWNGDDQILFVFENNEIIYVNSRLRQNDRSYSSYITAR